MFCVFNCVIIFDVIIQTFVDQFLLNQMQKPHYVLRIYVNIIPS